MALISTLSIPLTDDAGKTRRLPIHAPASVTVAQWQAFWDTVILELDVVTGSVIGPPSLTLQLTNAGLPKTSPLLDQFNRQGCLAGFQAADTTFRYSQFIPALRDSLINAGIPVLGAANALDDWTGRMIAGDGTVLPTDKNGNDLTALLGATLAFRK